MTSSIARRANIALLLTALALAAAGCTDFKRWAYARGDRDAWQQPTRVVESLGIEESDRVADVGSGGGYFTFHLARAVGETGRVIAVDVDQAMNEALEEDVAERGVTNVEVVLGGYDDPRLEPASVALIFTSNTFHHIDDRVAYFRNAAAALAPGGRVAIIDFKPEGFFQKRHATAAETIAEEMESAGYDRVESFEFLERQSFQVFAVRAR